MADDTTGNMANLALEDKLLDKSESRRGGGRDGGSSRRGGRGGRGGYPVSREVQVSKALSRLLRHQAENAGIRLDGEGYAPLDKVLAWGSLKSLGVTFAEVQDSVSSNEKQRFHMKTNPALEVAEGSTRPGDYLIRANQGHSIKVESSALLAPVSLEAGNVPARVLHGTYFCFWAAIVAAGGLKPMGRNHVHCSVGTPEEGVVSGMRKDAELLIEVDVERSLRDGVKWWLSDNGVVLTEGSAEGGVLGLEYFKRVTGRKVDVGVLWEDGVKGADLPEGIKMNVPMGKGGRGGRGGGRGGRGGRS